MQYYWLLFAIGAGLASNISNYITRYIVKDEKDSLTFSLFLEVFKIFIFSALAFFDFRINLSPKTIFLLLIIVISEPVAIFAYMKMHEYNHLSISSIITRTRMIIVAILAFLFLGESLSTVNYLGIIVLFLGLSFVVAPHKFLRDKGVKIATLFSVETAIFAVLIKYLSKEVSIPLIILISTFPAVFVFYFLMRNRKITVKNFVKNKFGLKTIFIFFNFIAFYGYVLAIKHGTVTIVTAIYQSMIIVSVIAGIIFLKEREDIIRKIAGSIVVVLGVILLTINPHHSLESTQSKETTTEEIRKIAKSINDDCQKKDADCFETSVRQKLLDVYPTYQILDAIYDWDTYFSCHAFTHFLGRALYQKTQSIPDSYSQINFTCHGGAYHGVIEAYLSQRNLTISSIDGDQIEQVCRDSRTKTDKNPEAVFSECLHGFGHAFMFTTDAELVTSLSYCDKLKVEFRERCYGGAFMENSTSSTNRDHPSRYLKADDKFFPCTILENQYLNQCYFYQANYLIMTSNHNFQKVFSDCYTLSQNQYNYCIMGIGAILASVSNETSIENAASVCGQAKDSARTICIEGAVPSLLQRYGGEVEKIIMFCNLSPDDLKDACFRKLGISSKIWHTDEQVESICQKTGIYHDACIGKKTVELFFN